MAAPDEIRMDERLMERDFGTWSGKQKIEMYDHLRNLNMDINDPMVSILSDEIETWTVFTERNWLYSNDLLYPGSHSLTTPTDSLTCIKSK